MNVAARRARVAVASGWRRLPANIRGALWVVAAGALFSVMAAVVKILGNRLDSFQIAFFRALFGLAAVLPFVWQEGLPRLRTRRPGMHLLRGVMGVSAMLCGFYAITHLPLADAVSLSFTRPLFLVPLAVLFLGERVRARRWAATAVGFLGVVVMLRPTGAIEPAAFVALAGALLVAGVSVLLKKLAATETPATILFYFGVISSTVALGPALYVWIAPTLGELLLLMLVGALAAAAQSFMIRAFAVAEATAVAPFDYVRILYAGLIGYALFAEVPDRWTVLGATIVAASTLYIARREAWLARRRREPRTRRAEQSGRDPGVSRARSCG